MRIGTRANACNDVSICFAVKGEGKLRLFFFNGGYVFCNLLGEMVTKGEYPEDYDTLKTIVQGVCYYNAKKYFNF